MCVFHFAFLMKFKNIYILPFLLQCDFYIVPVTSVMNVMQFLYLHK